MSLLIPDEGKLQLGKDILGNAALENWFLDLYQNNHTPAETDTAASYTVATFAGYTQRTLIRDTAGGHWSVPTLVAPTGGWAPGGQTLVAESTYAIQTYLPTSAQTIYGYYVTGVTSSKLIFAELYAAAKNLTNGDTLNMTPRFGDANAS